MSLSPPSVLSRLDVDCGKKANEGNVGGYLKEAMGGDMILDLYISLWELWRASLVRCGA